MATGKTSLTERAYAWLLRILPSEFRTDFGDQMTDVFRAQRSETESGGGGLRLWRLWAETLIDVLRTAPREHWDILRDDLGKSVRRLRETPGATLVTVATLALGIGANTAIFSVVDGVLLRPLPYADAAQLVHLRQQARSTGDQDTGYSVPEIEDYQSLNRSLAGVAEYHNMWFTLLGRTEPQRVATGIVSDNFFKVLGVTPILGRDFVPGDNKHGAEPVVLLAYDYWRESFGGDPGAVGQTFQMNDRVHTIVGVLPPLPPVPDANQVWMTRSSCPFRSSPHSLEHRTMRGLTLFGRVRPGVSPAGLRQDLAAIQDRLTSEHPDAYPREEAFETVPIPIHEEIASRGRAALLLLLATAGFVLLIACANVANLSLARLLRRQRELAVRAALGASRARLLRQALTESTLLALIGGALALGLASAGRAALVAFASRFSPLADSIVVDYRVFGFTLAVALLTGLVFGSLPAVVVGRDLAQTLKLEAGRATLGGRHRLRNALIVTQVALSFVLLVGTGLMARSLARLSQVNPGFRTENVLSLNLSLNWSKYATPKQRLGFYEPLLERVQALPGVRDAALALTVPLNDDANAHSAGTFEIEGHPIPPGMPRPVAEVRIASPLYFETVGIPLLKGRLFGLSDREGAPEVVLVSASLARRQFRDRDPVGERLSTDNGQTWNTIVGVVGDVRDTSLAVTPVDSIYAPLAQAPLLVANLLVRSSVPPLALARSVRAAVYATDPEQPVTQVRTLEEVRSESLATPRLTTLLLSSFSLLALLITATGLMGVMAVSVSERTREIGLRIAIGASRGRVVGMVLAQGLGLVLAGTALGAGSALALVGLMSRLLYEVRPTDPPTFLLASVLLPAVAVVACLLPAQRAAGVAPLVALREG